MTHIGIEHLKKILQEEYDNNDGFTYTQEFTKSDFVEYEIEEYLQLNEAASLGGTIEAFFSLGWYSADRLIYEILNEKDDARITEETKRAVTYLYLALYFGAKSCKCPSGGIMVSMHSIGLPLSINILCNEWEESQEIGTYLIDSLNANGCIIQRGDSSAFRSWFILDIFSKVFDIDIDKRIARYPHDTEYALYQTISESWDTEDIDIVDKNIYFLCDMHLDLALSKITDDNEEERREKLEIPHIQLFPYEILTWLKLREKQGLKNPTEFSHPLMNTPIAKMFLDIKEPLAKPTELPYAKELLEKLQEECPDVEIPEWLETMTQTNTIPDDFMNN